MGGLETQRLVLRNYCAEDWLRVHGYASIPEFSRFEMWGPNSEADTKKFITEMLAEAASRPRYKFNFAVCLRDSGLLIGGCGIRLESQASRVANLGWAISPEFQGRGYAPEAALELIRFGFAELDLQVIYATCDARNSASIRVMEKLAMPKVGHLTADKMQKGYLRDTLRFELIKGSIF